MLHQGTFERGTRRIIEDEAASLGATVCKTVTSKTELLVIGGSARAYGSKEDRAAELGLSECDNYFFQCRIMYRLLFGDKLKKNLNLSEFFFLLK